MEDLDGIRNRYERMRCASREMNSVLMACCEKSLIQAAAKELGVWVNGTLVMDIDQMAVLADHAIHRRAKDGHNVVDRYVAQHPPESGSDAEAVLAAGQRAFFSLFQIQDTVKGVGARVTDILRKCEHFLADVGLSRTGVKGMVVASRVAPFDDFIMTTGAPLLVDAAILTQVVDRMEEDDLSAEDMHTQSREAWAEFEALVIRTCLRSNNGEQRNGEYVSEAAPALVRDSTQPGRNDPCPCGSGKKYKRCCGL